MTLNDIDTIQKKLKITLHQGYVDLVTNYPENLINTEAPDFALLDTPEELIKLNIEVRKNGYFGEKWPEHYFIIGQNGCGDYYVTNHESKNFAIGFSDHEIMECNPYAKNEKEFISKILKEINE